MHEPQISKAFNKKGMHSARTKISETPVSCILAASSDVTLEQLRVLGELFVLLCIYYNPTVQFCSLNKMENCHEVAVVLFLFNTTRVSIKVA